MLKKRSNTPTAEELVRGTICPGCTDYIGARIDSYSTPGRPQLVVSCAGYKNQVDQSPGAWVRPGQCRSDAPEFRGQEIPKREQIPVFGVTQD